MRADPLLLHAGHAERLPISGRWQQQRCVSFAVVHFLLEAGGSAAVDANVTRGGGGKTALYWAAEGGHLEVVKALLAAGATDVQSNSGKKCSQVGSRLIREAILDSKK